MGSQEENANVVIEKGVTDNTELTAKSASYILRREGLVMSNLVLVYFFEYSITTSFGLACVVAIINKYPERKDDFQFKQAYVILNFCYQIGVFFSRSSL